MFSVRKKIFLLCMSLMLLLPLATVQAGIINNGPMIEGEYWQKRNPSGKKVILSEKQVAKYNKKLNKLKLGCVDLADLPTTFDGEELRGFLSDFSCINGTVYCDRGPVDAMMKEQMKTLSAVSGVPGKVKPVYGITVQHTDVRALPWSRGCFPSPGNRYFDVLQESTISAGEPVVLLHKSMDNKYVYVQMGNLRGWIAADDVAVCDKDKWLEYVEPKDFLVVTDKNYIIDDVFYKLGSKLILVKEKKKDYSIKIPVRDDAGKLQEKIVEIPKNDKVNKGYLPYTSNNVLEEAFRCFNDVYGWGGMEYSQDCSGLVEGIYRTMGFNLPRNTDEIAAVPGKFVKLDGLDIEARRRELEDLLPGAVINMKGHVMIYLGMVNGEPYVIHSAGSYYDEKGKKVYVRRIVVSDLNLGCANGKKMLETVYSTKEFK